MGRSTKRSLGPIFLIAAGLIVLIGALASIYLIPSGDQDAAIDTSDQQIPFAQIPRIDVASAKNALDERQAVIVDVRDRVYYEEAHINGASSIPLGEIESRLGELNRDDWIILYCT